MAQINCRKCGKEFEKTGKKQFCNDACRHAWFNEARYSKERKPPKTSTCAWRECDNTYEHVRPKEFCCGMCRQANHRDKLKVHLELKCKECGELFTQTHGRQVFCDDDCRLAHFEQKRRPNVVKRTGKCCVCGTEVLPKQMYCDTHRKYKTHSIANTSILEGTTHCANSLCRRRYMPDDLIIDGKWCSKGCKEATQGWLRYRKRVNQLQNDPRFYGRDKDRQIHRYVIDEERILQCDA